VIPGFFYLWVLLGKTESILNINLFLPSYMAWYYGFIEVLLLQRELK